MRVAEGVLLWAAVACYVATLVLGVAAVFRAEWPGRALRWAWPAAVLLHLAAGIARWIEAGHAPVQGTYENALSGSFFVAAIGFAVVARYPSARRGLPILATAVLLLLGHGVTARQLAVPLEPPFRSGWLVVHVTFAWLAFGSYVISAVMGLVYLIWRRNPARAERIELLDDLTGRLIAFGFATDTVMIASGALWAHGLWGRYWGWDPIETWSLVSWLIYGVNLHLRFSLGWRGPRAAWLAVASVVGVVITFFGISFVSNVHTGLL